MTKNSAKLFLAVALGAAVPLMAYAAADPDTSNEAAKSIRLPGGKKPPRTPKPLECPMEETGREICRDNGFGDQICEPEKVERCPLPL